MKRRTFLQTAAAALAANGAALAAAPMPMKKLGKSGLNVSRFCLGGYHMGRRDAETGIAIIHRALDLGVNFFDSAHHYNKGLSDEIYGRAIAPRDAQAGYDDVEGAASRPRQRNESA
jgi:predicted aldo/keto reductase-like oxidoreductase